MTSYAIEFTKQNLRDLKLPASEDSMKIFLTK